MGSDTPMGGDGKGDEKPNDEDAKSVKKDEDEQPEKPETPEGEPIE